MAKTANSFRLTAAEIFQMQQAQQLRMAGVLIKSYRDFTSSGNPSATQKDIALKAKTKQSVVSDLERGKKVPTDAILNGILKAVGLDTGKPEGKAVFNTIRAIRDTQDDIKKLPAHTPSY